MVHSRNAGSMLCLLLVLCPRTLVLSQVLISNLIPRNTLVQFAYMDAPQGIGYAATISAPQ